MENKRPSVSEFNEWLSKHPMTAISDLAAELEEKALHLFDTVSALQEVLEPIVSSSLEKDMVSISRRQVSALQGIADHLQSIQGLIISDAHDIYSAACANAEEEFKSTHQKN